MILKTTDNTNKTRIVVMDGWPDLEKMLPSINRKNLSILEMALLQILKETAQEVIWVDSGVAHPQMNKALLKRIKSSKHANKMNTVIEAMM